MPSPVAHSLAGFAIASASAYLRGRRAGLPDTHVRNGWPFRVPLLTVATMIAAIAPDFDFVPGILVGHPDWLHRGVSHSLGAAVVVGACVWSVLRPTGVRDAALAGVLMTTAYASHLALDMFSPDPLRFNGVPLFWPLSDQHFVLPAQVFLDIRRDPAAGGFAASLWHVHNLEAVLRELLVMLPALLLGRLAVSARPGGVSPAQVRPRLDRRIDSES